MADPVTASPSRRRPLRVVGLDLAGSPRRRTGFCLLVGPRDVEVAVLGDDDEILERAIAARPDLVSIDAPLSLPRGRASLESRGPPHLRACDRELLRRRIRFFPITLGPMRMLTARGLRIARALQERGLRSIESYPGGAQDVLGMPRKHGGVEPLRRALRSYGMRGEIDRNAITHDELDAVTCAIVGRLFLLGRADPLGDPTEGILVLPRPVRSCRPPTAGRPVALSAPRGARRPAAAAPEG